MEYGGITIIKSILPVDLNDIMSFFIQKKGTPKMALLPKSKLSILNVSSANTIYEMKENEMYLSGSNSPL